MKIMRQFNIEPNDRNRKHIIRVEENGRPSLFYVRKRDFLVVQSLAISSLS